MADTKSRCRTCGDWDGWILETDVDPVTGLVTSHEAPCPWCRPASRHQEDPFRPW
ncbi:hypothetical protein [Amycolatopsis granulosa]|uniref:hypothetical protein n=1 Tax=Amycolatopsis granulosa TaxID=185684 RepID=UPI001ABAB3C5|nr:hypothetical protein [Amycolatopsis granulosa]NIH84504.1 hypothetical protein [Amycolatopsis granulosa]